MKKILTVATFFAMTTFATAQQEQQINDDQLQQQAPRETQVRTERAATNEAKSQALDAKKKEEEAKEAAEKANSDAAKKAAIPAEKKVQNQNSK